MIPTDKDYFKIIIGISVVPILYFLGLVLFAVTGYCILHAANDVNKLVLGALAFLLGYNSMRLGWIWRA